MYLAETHQPKLVAPVFHLDCKTGCATATSLPPFCNTVLGRAISDARSLALNAAQRLEAEFVLMLSKDLAAAPLNVESAIEKHKAWKAKDALLAAKVKTAEKLESFGEPR